TLSGRAALPTLRGPVSSGRRTGEGLGRRVTRTYRAPRCTRSGAGRATADSIVHSRTCRGAVKGLPVGPKTTAPTARPLGWGREPHLHAVGGGRGGLALVAEDVQARVGGAVGAREGGELGEQRAGQPAAPLGAEHGQARVVDPRWPVGMRGEEAAQVRLVEVAERGLPEAAVLAQLPGEVGEALRLLVELGERARAEDTEGVRDAVEQADLGLPRRPVAPRLAPEGIDQRRGLL